MELPAPSREARGKSAEFDGRRINAVQPMHQGESMLQNLWKEHQQQQAAAAASSQASQQSIMSLNEQQMMMQGTANSGSLLEESDRKLQQMLEKYQSQVKLQQQRNPTPAQQKQNSRNNLHKIEKVASTVHRVNAPGSGGPPQCRTMSHSQPCLIAITDRPPEYTPLPLVSHPYQRRSSGSGEQAGEMSGTNGLGNQRVPNNQKLILSLREENLHQKREMEALKKKLLRLQQIESAYDRIERDYESLLRDKDRQDSLEKTALAQMEMHLKRVMTEKDALQERLEQSSTSMASYQHAQAVEKINQLNMVLADLITQNKDLQACKDRQRMEIDAQTATLEEQRNHIAMLDKALTNAQERLQKKDRAYEELNHVAESNRQLQRQLQETLMDKQARDEAHSGERAQWEMEITQLKMQLNKDPSLSGSLKRSSGVRLSTDTNDETLTRLKKTIYTKDERITQLERTVVELQRKQHDEMERKNGQMVALGEGLEAKIKKLEEERAEKDKRISELLVEREKLGEIIGENRERGDFFYPQERETDVTRDYHRMEQIKEKIQERKRKGRVVGVAGGLMGVVEHGRSNSGSLLQTASPHRTGGAFDGPLFDTTVLPDFPGITYSRPMDTNGNGFGLYTTTVAFRSQDTGLADSVGSINSILDIECSRTIEIDKYHEIVLQNDTLVKRRQSNKQPQRNSQQQREGDFSRGDHREDIELTEPPAWKPPLH